MLQYVTKEPPLHQNNADVGFFNGAWLVLSMIFSLIVSGKERTFLTDERCATHNTNIAGRNFISFIWKSQCWKISAQKPTIHARTITLQDQQNCQAPETNRFIKKNSAVSLQKSGDRLVQMHTVPHYPLQQAIAHDNSCRKDFVTRQMLKIHGWCENLFLRWRAYTLQR